MDLNALKKLSISKQSPVSKSPSTEVRANDIAIIGLNAAIGSAKNVEELWDNLRNGFDLIRDFPAERWEDANRLHQLKFHKPLSEELIPCSYLDRLDLFDAGLFQLSRTEAEVMDPAQRLFLESAWSALEDAGYGGDQLDGSKTGVFLGYSSVQNPYGAVIEAADANTYGVAVSGNVDAIIASRISYLLNLKGPAVNIDTSCSSSLVAVHLACQQIRDGEVSMALAGSIRLKTMPPEQIDRKMGIESSSARTKTFDDGADGTGAGEGVICIVLKSLRQAVRDRDNIYAVIKGSSINQDGASIGITAPNAAAQEEVIRAAWKDAGINPETISYIEAHGTATNLGDPIEINGIERAFGRFTDKKQFCAIGSLKTNVGHLDCASGLAGLLKAVLMLKNKQLPPTLHFEVPNRKIDFSSSPVYVNDKLMPWESADGPRRCGVSSFGMSGTNCHLVLEEAPVLDSTETSAAPARVLTASAKNRDTVQRLIEQYQAHLKQFPDCNLDDFCYTANIGRGHYNCRFTMVLDSVDDFVNQAFDQSLLADDRCIYREHKVIDTETQLEGYITSSGKKVLTEQAALLIEQVAGEQDADTYKSLLQEIVELYVQGADVPWERLYKKEARHRLSIPAYPYNRKRHWITLPDKEVPLLQKKEKAKLHPLIHQCVLDTYQMQVYETEMSIDTCWELKYHKINGMHVLPGTAFIEMAQFVSSRYLKHARIEIQELLYMIPLVCKGDEVRTVHTMAKMEDSVLTITCYSKNDDEHEWTHHLELVVREACEQVHFTTLHTDEIIGRCEQADTSAKLNALSIVEIEGDKWNNLKGVYLNDEEVLLHLQLDSSLSQEMKKYFLYPSLLDPAINGGNFLMQSVHLPFSCSKARFYEALPENMYSHIKRKKQGNETNEFAAFDITLFAEDGRVVAELEDYIIKKVHQSEFFMMNQNSQHNMYHGTSWVPYEKTYATALEYQGDNDLLLVLHRPDQESSPLMEQLHHRFGHRLAAVQLAEENDFDSLLSSLPKENIKHIVQLASLANLALHSVEDAVSETKLVLKSTFGLVKALLNHDVRQDIRLTLMTSNAIPVTGDEEQIHPINRALIGMGASIGEEYANILTRAIDCDEHTDAGTLLEELLHDEPMYAVAYRGNKRYMEQMDTLPYEQPAEQKLELKDQGTYIITGGLGGMGLALCRYLFSVNPEIHVILLNRTYSREAFEALTAHDDALLQNKIDQVNKLWTEGKNLDILQVDVADYDQIKATLQDIRDRNGAIDGVIHAAGVAGDGFILMKDWETFEAVISPKIYGTWVLHELTRDDQLNFFVMCSSFASVFGAAGQSDYITANAYLDSFTYYRRNLGVPSLTINWTGWSESGMAVSNGVNANGMYVHFVKDAEGAHAFAHALQTRLHRVLVGEINYSVLASGGQAYARKIRLSEQMMEKQGVAAKATTPTASRDLQNVVVTGKSMDKLTEIEKNVIAAWVQTLGVDEVDVHDKFFESGGNSLLASYLHKEMNKVYPGMTAITDIFVYSSVAEISNHIASKIGPSAEKLVIEEDENKQNKEDLKKLVAQFSSGDMDLDQMLALLNGETNQV